MRVDFRVLPSGIGPRGHWHTLHALHLNTGCLVGSPGKQDNWQRRLCQQTVPFGHSDGEHLDCLHSQAVFRSYFAFPPSFTSTVGAAPPALPTPCQKAVGPVPGAMGGVSDEEPGQASIGSPDKSDVVVIKLTQSCPTLCNPMGCSLRGCAVHWIFQATVLEWVAISFSRGSSQPRDRTQVSRIVHRDFTIWATR